MSLSPNNRPQHWPKEKAWRIAGRAMARTALEIILKAEGGYKHRHTKPIAGWLGGRQYLNDWFGS
jgi:hypothetical protein